MTEPEKEPEKEPEDEEVAGDEGTDNNKNDEYDDKKTKSSEAEETIKDPETGEKVTRKVQRQIGPRGGKKYRVKNDDGDWGDWNYGTPTTYKKKVKEGRLKTLAELKNI